MSGEKFCGKCQIKACHANLPLGLSHCLYLFYPEKTDFDKYDVMFALGINEKQFKDGYNLGKSKIYAVVALFNILSRLRANNKSDLSCSPEQVEQNQLFLQKSYLRLPEFSATVADVQLLLNNQDKLQIFLNQSSNLQLELHQLLGLDREFLDQSNLVRQQAFKTKEIDHGSRPSA